MASELCLFCRRRFAIYAPQAGRQRTCKRETCRYRLRLLLNRAWRARKRGHNASWREAVNRRLREWARDYPRYWQAYRQNHSRYAAFDNVRRARAMRRLRWGCSAKDES
jgi:hypothetical protein